MFISALSGFIGSCAGSSGGDVPSAAAVEDMYRASSEGSQR